MACSLCVLLFVVCGGGGEGQWLSLCVCVDSPRRAGEGGGGDGRAGALLGSLGGRCFEALVSCETSGV